MKATQELTQVHPHQPLTKAKLLELIAHMPDDAVVCFPCPYGEWDNSQLATRVTLTQSFTLKEHEASYSNIKIS